MPSAETRSVVVSRGAGFTLVAMRFPERADLYGFGRRGGVRQGGEGGWMRERGGKQCEMRYSTQEQSNNSVTAARIHRSTRKRRCW